MLNRHQCLIGIVIAFAGSSYAYAENPTAIMQKVVEKLRSQTEIDDEYGYYQRVRIRKFESDFRTVKDEERRLYRTIWMLDKPFQQLIKINGVKPGPTEKAKESRRKSDFLKQIKGSNQQSGNIEQEIKKIQWWSIYSRYDYKLEPPESNAAYVISFQPRSADFPTTTRLERVMKEIAGKIWIDADFNILKVETFLKRDVNFGFGLIAKIEQMQATYTQQKFQNVWLPASLKTTFHARIAMVRTERREVQVEWYDPYPQSSKNQPAVAAAGL